MPYDALARRDPVSRAIQLADTLAPSATASIRDAGETACREGEWHIVRRIRRQGCASAVRSVAMSRHHLLALFIAACGRGPAPAAAPSPPAPRDDAPGTIGSLAGAAVTDQGSDSPPHAALTAADCRAFAEALGLGIAVVASSTPDCSGIGHARIVLEVQHLSRGGGIRSVVTSRPLYSGDHAERMREGDVLVVAMTPNAQAARTVSCVRLPASDGDLERAVVVTSVDAGRRLIDAILDGSACPAP